MAAPMLRTLKPEMSPRFLRQGLVWLSRIVAAAPVARVVAVVVVWAGLTAADTVGTHPDTSDIASTITLPAPGEREVLPPVRNPFRPGETLKFSVQSGFISAGTAYLEVPEVRDFKGQRVFSLVARAESNAFISRVYKVRNRIESLWDADGRTFPIPPQVQDALSSFYYTRYQSLPLGGSIVFDYHASRKSQPMEVKVLGRERVKTPAGTFDCVAIEPMLKAGGIFSNKGRLVIWITDDERRMPVRMKSAVAIGSISVVLKEYRLGG